jgi:mannose-6-phosphate isomerase-like protein (cupin superfamily)
MEADMTELPRVYQERVRYVSVEDGFNLKRPDLRPCIFMDERRRAFDPNAPTGFIPLDRGGVLETGFPATLPLVLARYLRIRAEESLTVRLKASGEIYVVLSGRGRTEREEGVVEWGTGDIVVLPGGEETMHRAGEDDCVLFVVTNEPLLVFERLEPPLRGNAPVAITRYTAAALAEQLEVRSEGV